LFSGGDTVKTIYNLPTYNKDKRLSLFDIYKSYSEINKNYWIKNILNISKIKYEKKEFSYFINTFRTKKKGKALWLIAGIHGEEPAGPNAISKNIEYINKLGKKIPIVLLPLCNPIGYMKNWRYPYSKTIQKDKEPKSVGDSEHCLIDLKDTRKPRRNNPILKESELITKFVLKQVKDYPPLLVLDLHEDDSVSDSYIFSQGFLRHKDPIAKEIIKLLRKRKFRIKKFGFTSFKQKIVNGIVTNVKDDSIDELLSTYRLIINKSIKKGPQGKSVVVVETNSKKIKLKKRVTAHSYIIKNLLKYYNITKKIKS